MLKSIGKFASIALVAVATSLVGWAQTSSLEGDVKGPDGKGLKDALIKIERTDIKGNYKVKSDKKGHWFHAGLPLGMYKITLEVDGKEVDTVNGVRTRLGDPTPVNFDLAAMAARQAALQKAADTGTLTAEAARDMTPEQKAAIEKQVKERSAAMQKNKALNDAFNGGMEAMKTQNYAVAIESFNKAAEMDPKQVVIYAQLADAHSSDAKAKTGAEQEAALGKALESYQKAIELKPDDAAFHNNFALALARAKKYDESRAELDKAAMLDPTNAGKYYFNLGAILVNTGQNEPAGQAFKKAIELDPNYADAHYQWGIYLTGKAVIAADGKMTFPEGAKEAFEKYLALRPDGRDAESAKGMIQTMGGSLDLKYQNPSAKPSTTKKK